MEWRRRARVAGLRTHVAAGAGLFVLYAVVAGNANALPGTACVVRGIGFPIC